MGSDTYQVEWSGFSTEEKFTGLVGNPTTESSRKGVEGVREQAQNPNRVTQHQVREDGGFGGRSESTTARQCWDHSPTGEVFDQWDTHALQRRLKGIGDGVGDK